MHVPREALIRGGKVDRVVIALGDGRFRAQPVDIGIEAGDRVEIRSGLSSGDLIVTSGQFLIDSESNIESALMRMDDQAASPLPSRVRIGAVVRSTDPRQSTLTLQHDPVPAWSWPAMTMSFDVTDASMIEGLRDGQAVEIVIEKYADGRHRVTAILPGSNLPATATDDMDHSDHDMGAGTAADEADHAGHDMKMHR